MCQWNCIYKVVSCFCPRPEGWLLAHELGNHSTFAWPLYHIISVCLAWTKNIAYCLPLMFFFSLLTWYPYWLVGFIGWIMHTHGSEFKHERRYTMSLVSISPVSSSHPASLLGGHLCFRFYWNFLQMLRDGRVHTHLEWGGDLAKAPFHIGSIWGALLFNEFKARVSSPLKSRIDSNHPKNLKIERYHC